MTENKFSNPCLVYVREFIILIYSVIQGMLRYQIPKSRNVLYQPTAQKNMWKNIVLYKIIS